MSTRMNARDAVSAALAECYVNVDGRRYNFMQAIDVEITAEKIKKEVPILGQVTKGNKSVGLKYKGKAKFHYNMSIFRDLLIRYQDKGEDVYFDMMIVNEDPTSSAGRQTVIAKNCNIDGGLITKFDADGDYLEDEFDFTVERIEMPERFKELVGV